VTQQSHDLTLLVLAACPADQTRLRHSQEFKTIRSTLSVRKCRYSIHSSLCPETGAGDVSESLNQHHPQLVHISGHGDGSEIALEGRMASDGAGMEFWKGNFKTQKDTEHPVHLVVFSACQSSTLAEELAKNGLVSFAVGFPGKPLESDALAFATRFYQHLAEGRSVLVSFNAGLAAATWKGCEPPKLYSSPGYDAGTRDVMLKSLRPTPVPLYVGIALAILVALGVGAVCLWGGGKPDPIISPNGNTPPPSDPGSPKKNVTGPQTPEGPKGERPGSWQNDDIKIEKATFAPYYFTAKRHVLSELAVRLNKEALAVTDDKDDFAVLVVQLKPLAADRQRGALRIAARGCNSCELAGCAVVRKPGAWITKPEPLTRPPGGYEVRVPECRVGDTVVLLIEVRGPQQPWFTSLLKLHTSEAKIRESITDALTITAVDSSGLAPAAPPRQPSVPGGGGQPAPAKAPWTPTQLEVATTAFARRSPHYSNHALQCFADRLAEEGNAEKEEGFDSVELTVETKPLGADTPGGVLRVVPRGPGVLSGYCFRQRGELFGECHEYLYKDPKEGDSRVFIPPSPAGSSLLLILRLRARPGELPTKDNELTDLIKLEALP
jgi:hypothetical protein